MLSYIISFFKNLLFEGPRLLATLHGHSGSVVNLAISPNGKLLASGGTDGIKIWDMKVRKEIAVPQQPFHERGQVSCVCWITRNDESFDTLCYGNALGFLVFLQHRPTEGRFELVHSVRIARGGEILCMKADISGGSSIRFATGTRDKCVQVWSFDSNSRKLIPIHSKAYADDKDIVPKALAFDGSKDQNLYVFGLYDGGLHKYGGTDGKWICTHQLGSKIGNADINLEHRLCVVDNVGNGFDIYKLDSGHFVRTLVTREPIKTYPKGVSFANHCQAVVAGSDHGLVYILNRKTGRVIKTLKNGKGDGVQTIAVRDDDAGVTIASASATSNGPSPIHIWRWTPKGRANKDQNDDGGWSVIMVMEFIIKTIVIVAAAAYVRELSREFKWVLPFKTQSGILDNRTSAEGQVLDNRTTRDYIRQEMMEEMVKSGYRLINSTIENRNSTES